MKHRSSLQVRVRGALEPTARGFHAELVRQGYSEPWCDVQMRFMAGLSLWLTNHELGVADLTSVVIADFVSDRHAPGARKRLKHRSIGPLVTYLRSQGLVHRAVGASTRSG